MLQILNEALSVKNLANMFYSGYRQVSPGNTRTELHDYSYALNNDYNVSITDALTNRDPRTNALANILATMYTKTHQTKQELFELYRAVKDLDAASRIVDDYIDDAINTTDGSAPFTVQVNDELYDHDKIALKCQKFMKKYNVSQTDLDTMEDYLVLGDYYFETKVDNGGGIVEFNDNVDISNVFSIYKNYNLIQHIGMNTNSIFSSATINGLSGQLIPIHPDLLSHFTLDARKINITLPGEKSSVFALAENIKIGRSVLFTSLALLKKYQLLDMALNYKELRNALMPIMLSLTTGAFTTPDKMIEACRTVESYLQDNTAMNFDIENMDAIEQMLQGASSVKVAPVPGDKGQVNRLDIGQGINETEGLSNLLKSTGDRIDLTAGGIDKNNEGKSRLEVLKSNSRRSRRLLDIQKGRANGWRDTLVKHCRYSGMNIEPESIKVIYKSIPNADCFEEANGVVTLLSVVNDIMNFVNTTNETKNGVHANPEKIIAACDFFLGKRYPFMEDFLKLDVVKNEFPYVNDYMNLKKKPQTYTGTANDEEKDKMQQDTTMNNPDDLQKMNKAFPGSSGSSDAVGQ